MDSTKKRLGPLNIQTVVALSEVIGFASQCARIVWVDNDHRDGLRYGTARAIVVDPQRPNFPDQMDDVRACYLWVTGREGLEHFLDVEDCIRMVTFGEMAKDPS